MNCWFQNIIEYDEHSELLNCKNKYKIKKLEEKNEKKMKVLYRREVEFLAWKKCDQTFLRQLN